VATFIEGRGGEEGEAFEVVPKEGTNADDTDLAVLAVLAEILAAVLVPKAAVVPLPFVPLLAPVSMASSGVAFVVSNGVGVRARALVRVTGRGGW